MTGTVEVFIACSYQPSTEMGGWAALLSFKGVEKVINGLAQVENYDYLHLIAAKNALSTLKRPCKVRITSNYHIEVISNQKLRSLQHDHKVDLMFKEESANSVQENAVKRVADWVLILNSGLIDCFDI